MISRGLTNMIEFFIRSWKGEESLAKVFWLLYGVLGLVVVLIILIPFAILIPNFFTQEVITQYGDLINAISFPYVAFSAVCVWRCAKNSTAIKAFFAKAIVVISVISCFLSVFHLMMMIQ